MESHWNNRRTCCVVHHTKVLDKGNGTFCNLYSAKGGSFRTIFQGCSTSVHFSIVPELSLVVNFPPSTPFIFSSLSHGSTIVRLFRAQNSSVHLSRYHCGTISTIPLHCCQREATGVEKFAAPAVLALQEQAGSLITGRVTSSSKKSKQPFKLVTAVSMMILKTTPSQEDFRIKTVYRRPGMVKCVRICFWLQGQ